MRLCFPAQGFIHAAYVAHLLLQSGRSLISIILVMLGDIQPKTFLVREQVQTNTGYIAHMMLNPALRRTAERYRIADNPTSDFLYMNNVIWLSRPSERCAGLGKGAHSS